MTHDNTVHAYFSAMRRGAAAEEEMMALFTDDVVYIEPFTDPENAARGIDEVRARLRTGWETPLPEMELEVHQISVDGDTATSRWTCRSPALPTPTNGTDHYRFRDGLISHLEVVIDSQKPDQPQP